jgi:hypothetical protein
MDVLNPLAAFQRSSASSINSFNRERITQSAILLLSLAVCVSPAVERCAGLCLSPHAPTLAVRPRHSQAHTYTCGFDISSLRCISVPKGSPLFLSCSFLHSGHAAVVRARFNLLNRCLYDCLQLQLTVTALIMLTLRPGLRTKVLMFASSVFLSLAAYS